MALNTEFEGFVQETKTLSWGRVTVVTHNNRAKNDAGVWETVSKDYIDVVLSDDMIAPINDTLVRVKGTQTSKAYAKKDGTLAVSLKIRAQEITPVDRNRDPIAAVRSVVAPAGWEPVAEDMPF